MARSAQELEQFKKAFMTYLGRTPEDTAVSAFQSAPISLADRIAEIQNSPEAMGFRSRQVAARYSPVLEQLDFQTGQAKNEADLARSALDLQRNQLDAEIADAIKRVNESQKQQQTNFMNQQQRLGIRPSGLSVGGLEQLATDTGTTLNRLEQNRANRLAQLALQRTGIEGTYASAARQGQLSRQNVSEQIRQAIEQTGEQDFNRQLQMATLAEQLPAGRTVNLGGFGQVQGRGVRGEQATALFQNPILLNTLPDDVLRQLLESYGFTVTD